MTSERTGWISVVIPTWNEEGWLPELLRNLEQLPEVGEVVVSDNDSTDRSVQIASMFGCRITQGGLPGTARNNGAQVCSSDKILFLDADTIIPGRSLRAALDEMESDPHLSAVSFKILPAEHDFFAQCGYELADLYFRICSRVGITQGLGNAILVRSAPFNAIGGFDERVRVGEDVDLLRRMNRHSCRVKYLSRSPVFTSIRRFKVENNLIFTLKVLMWTSVRLIGVPWSPIPYKWQNYPLHWGIEDAARFKQITEDRASHGQK
ncbi:glycosyltransferase [Nocardia niigatensis]